MPVVAPGSKVLVTGANGFAAINIVDLLLKKGYSVRATIRSESKGTYLKKIFGKYGDKLEFVVVRDVAKVGPIQSCEVRRRLTSVPGRRF
jgi:nucleoside-diphosphate-sugar epimerase